jgi:hypothetical protein
MISVSDFSCTHRACAVALASMARVIKPAAAVFKVFRLNIISSCAFSHVIVVPSVPPEFRD